MSCCKSAAGDTAAKAQQPELADIFREYGGAYRKAHALSNAQLWAMNNIEGCRTAYLGGHLKLCDSCGYEHPVYNSCGNRHCPKCQSLQKARWLAARKAELLPVPYFHNVFTLPHQLNTLARCNKKVTYDILFASVSQTLLAFGKNSENGFGGKIGLMAILHTWDQKLLEHIHLHCVIPAGALSFDKKRWIYAPHSDFLFPVKALSKVFRGKFIDNLEKAYTQGEFTFVGQSEEFKTKKGFQSLTDELWKTNWVVYSKKPFAGPEQVLDYLARYTHRTAISNNRIKKVEDGHVTFTYRDRRDGDRLKEITLTTEKFIRRFLLHILPDSYTRIHYYGFFSNRYRKENVSQCRKLLGLSGELPEIPKQGFEELMLQLTGKDMRKCPRCKTGNLTTSKEIPRLLAMKMNNDFVEPEVIDTS